VREAEDCLVGFEDRGDVERCGTERRERWQPLALELHPEKTRRLECGRFATERRARRRQGKPETFDLLGFTPRWRKTRQGKCPGRRKTMVTRLRKTLQAVKDTLRMRMHWPIPRQGAWLHRVRLGHDRSDGVPRNGSLLTVCRATVLRSWCRTFRRRRQRHRMTWQRIYMHWPSHGCPNPIACIRILRNACALSPAAGARCGRAARRDLCGGCRVTGIPTATALPGQSKRMSCDC
jgi:RNA-directed DNA polymerase